MSTMQTQETSGILLVIGNSADDQAVDMDTNSYETIICIETELSAYRRGSIRVRIDFEKKIVTWKDSRQWNNNFFRSLSQQSLDQLRNELPQTDLLHWDQNNAEDRDNVSSACAPSDWAVSVYFSDDSILRLSGNNSYPKEWKKYRTMIETITKSHFCLR